jgi:hypothetical protein
VLKDYGISLGKGFVKLGLYATDEAGYITQIKMNKQTGKLYIPKGTKAISDKFGRTKTWSGYNFKTNPLRDPDFQNVAVTTSFVLVGVTSPAIAVKLFGAVKGKAIYDAVKNPTPYNNSSKSLIVIVFKSLNDLIFLNSLSQTFAVVVSLVLLESNVPTKTKKGFLVLICICSASGIVYFFRFLSKIL